MGCYKLTYNHLQIVRTHEDQSLGRGRNGVGLIVSGLNHAMHQMDSYDEITEDKNNSGKVRFKGFTNKELDEYRVALEEPIDNVTIITPKSDVTYDADGFYFENPTEDNYWFKIGDGKSVLVTPLRGDGRISFESRGLNFKISVLSYHSNYYNFFSDMGIRFKGEQDHWTINPFKLKK